MALCRELFKEFRSAHPGRNVRFRSAGDATGECDADRLRQAVFNLLGNAVQHGPDDAVVGLIFSGEANDVVVAVHLAGPPLPPGELSKIFDPLVRGASAGQPKQNRPGSIGLGLSIAREIAQPHGGRIDVTSSDAAGATTLRLPRHRPASTGQTILDHAHVHAM